VKMKTAPFIKLSVPLYAFFGIAWLCAASTASVFGEVFKTSSEIFFLFICLGIAGIYFPIIIERKYQIPYNKPSYRNNTIIGIILFFTAAAIEIAFFSSWSRIIINNPDDLIRLKHVMITLPITMAITLQFFFMTGKIIESSCHNDKTAPIIEVVISALLMGLGLYAETRFTRIDVFFTMTAAGAFIGAGYILTGKFYLTFVAVFLTVYANSLSEARYIDYSWSVTIAGFIFYMIALMTGFSIPVKKTQLPLCKSPDISDGHS
jgi:hypothetical protein